MKAFHLEGKKLDYYEVDRYAEKGKKPEVRIRDRLDTSCEVHLDTTLSGNNLELILKTINFDNLEEIRQNSGFGAFKYFDIMSPKDQKEIGLTDMDKQREEYRKAKCKVSGQRSIIVTLDEPVDGYTAVKIKGRVYARLTPHDDRVIPDVCPPIMLPYEGFGLGHPLEQFNRKGKQTSGGPMALGPANPYGGMLRSRAIREYEMTKKMQKAKLPTCMPLGYGVFTSPNYKPNRLIKERAAFVILGIRDSMDYRLTDNIVHAQNREDFAEYVDFMFTTFGKTLRKMHDKGFYHGMPHIENISFQEENILLHDTDNAGRLTGLSIVQEAMYRLRELDSAARLTKSLTAPSKKLEEAAKYECAEHGPSGIVLRHLATANISRILHEKNAREPIESFSKGYFGKEMPIPKISDENLRESTAFKTLKKAV